MQHLDVLVDESPPVNGTVKELEDLSEESESDFTSDGKVKVKWNGFIDHESGISHYEIFSVEIVSEIYPIYYTMNLMTYP